MTIDPGKEDQCPHCGRPFATRRALASHWRARHPEPIPAERCSACAGLGPLLAKGMCGRCYARSRRVRGHCAHCGAIRVLPGGRRCQRCIQRASTRPPSTCADCLSWGPLVGRFCLACQQFRRKGKLGVCPGCRREVPLGWGDHCRLCLITRYSSSLREGVCPDCGCFTRLVTSRCNTCQVFRSRGELGCCTLCGNEVVIGRLGRCRRCLVDAARSGVRYPGRPIGHAGPDGSPAPGSGGIQLFFAGMRDAGIWPSRDTDPSREPGDVSCDRPKGDLLPGQLRLIWVPADLSRIRLEDTHGAADAERGDLAFSVVAFGEARGWSRPTVREVQRAVAVMAAARCGENEIDACGLPILLRLGLPVERTVEFLNDAGLQVVDPKARIEAWVEDTIRHLPERIRAEVGSWIEVLRGRSARRARPVRPRTVKVYLRACLPALDRWASRYDSLRQVTDEDVEAELVGLRGWAAVNTLTGLRSLFRTLKANCLIFANPAARVHALAPPHRAPLGLDPSLRRALLDHLDRHDHRLIVALAGVHALSKSQIAGLRLDHLDLAGNRFFVKGRPRPLDALTREHLDAWLAFRRTRWPRTANPHVLVTVQSANNLAPVGPTYLTYAFRSLPVTASKLRIDRLVSEALESRGDALRIALFFGMSAEAAAGYAAAFTELDGMASAPEPPGSVCG